MVCRLHEYVRQQDRQNAEPDVQHRGTAVFASTVHARLLVRHYWIGLKNSVWSLKNRPTALRIQTAFLIDLETVRLLYFPRPGPFVKAVRAQTGSNALISLFLLGRYLRVLPNCC